MRAPFRRQAAPKAWAASFDKEEAGVFSFQGGEGVPIGALAVQMHGENRFDVAFRPGGEDFGYGVRSEVEGQGIDVREETAGPGAEDGAGAGEEGERRGDDGVLG